MADYTDPLRFSAQEALRGGYEGYGAKYAVWAERHPQVDRHGRMVYRPKPDAKTRSEFLVVPQPTRGGVTWWNVHRRLADNERDKTWRWVARFPYAEEASAYIEDMLAGRERVYFQGIRFDKKALSANKSDHT